MSIRVAIADGQPLYRDALARTVRQCSAFQLVAEDADGRAALDRIRRERPQVAILDVRLPGLEGRRVLRAVSRDALPTAILLIGALERPEDAYAAVADGASGCLSKAARPEDICEAIRVAARGGTVLEPHTLGVVVREIRLRERGGRPLLSPRELEILRRIAAGERTPAIARALHLSESTVKTHVAHSFEKLGVADRAAAVAEGMRRGLLE
jgi:two-component system nitrate/nitrite response regulator NarL